MHPIDLIDAQLLKIAAPEAPISYLAGWAEPLKLGCVKFGIADVRQIAAMLAQAAHESCGFQHLEENLSYSAARLCAVWPHRFPSIAAALPFARNPEALANHVYAGREGNGPPESGDGWLFRGRGPFELTFRNNYQAFADAAGIALADAPAYVETINGGSMSACWFFKANNLAALADTPGIQDETKAINGGLIGLDDRRIRFNAVVAEMLRRGA